MFELGTLGKTSSNPYIVLLLLAGVVAVAYMALGASLLRQGRDKDDLRAELESGTAVLAAADDVRQDLEVLPSRLDEARQELEAAQAAFPSELNSNSIMQTVLELAVESRVAVRSVETAPPVAEPEEEESTTESTLTYDVEVEGDLGQLTAFLEALVEGEISTAKIGAFTLEEGDGRYLLDIELVAHARSTALEAHSSEQGAAEGQVVVPGAPHPAPSPEQGSGEGQAVIRGAAHPILSPGQGSALDEGTEATSDGEEAPEE